MANDQSIRIATFAAPLSRDGPGLLLRDILSGDDPQIRATAAIIATVAPDILLLTDFDFDLDRMAARAFADLLSENGLQFDYHFTSAPNTGQMTDLDLDQDGRTGTPRDAQGYGRFTGDGGLLLLSRWPIADQELKDFTGLLWREIPDAIQPEGMAEAVWNFRKLSSTAHWVVPVETPIGPLELATWSATPPVFDGEEDRNGLRNAAEASVWSLWLDGYFGAVPQAPLIIGNANLDPVDGEGLHGAIVDLLQHPAVQDPRPASAGGQANADLLHLGDPSHDTADWSDDGPGNLRVSYVLPPADWAVVDAGVFWPAPSDPDAALLGEDGLAAGPHRLVWVDVRR